MESLQIHINIPYTMLIEHLGAVLEKELNPEIYFSGNDLDAYRVEDLLDAVRDLREQHRSITVHGPFMDLSPGGMDRKVRDVTCARFSQLMEIASLIKPRVIVLHPGYNRWFFDDRVDLWLKNSLPIWEPLVEEAQQLRIPLAIENVFEEEPASLEKLFRSIDSPYFKFCFDTGHYHLFSRVRLSSWFEVLGSQIIEVHLHDNLKSRDDHLPIGEGSVDFEAFFSLLSKWAPKAVLTVEPHEIDRVDRSLKACRDFLRNFSFSGAKGPSYRPPR